MTDVKELTPREQAKILLEAILQNKWQEVSAAARKEIEAGHHGEALFAIRKLLNNDLGNNCTAILSQTGDDGFRYFSDKIEWGSGRYSFSIELKAKTTYFPTSSEAGFYKWNEIKECFQYYYLDELDHLLTYLVYRAKSKLNRGLELKEPSLRTTMIEALNLDVSSVNEFFKCFTPNDKLIKEAQHILANEHQAEEVL